VHETCTGTESRAALDRWLVGKRQIRDPAKVGVACSGSLIIAHLALRGNSLAHKLEDPFRSSPSTQSACSSRVGQKPTEDWENHLQPAGYWADRPHGPILVNSAEIEPNNACRLAQFAHKDD